MNDEMRNKLKKYSAKIFLFLMWSIFPFGVFYFVGEYISNRLAIFIGVSSIFVFFIFSKKIIKSKEKRVILSLVSPMFLYFIAGLSFLGYSHYESYEESKTEIAEQPKTKKSTLIVFETSKIGIGNPNINNLLNNSADTNTISVASHLDILCDNFTDTISITSYFIFIGSHIFLDISILDKDLNLEIQETQINNDEGSIIRAIDEYGRFHGIIINGDESAIYLNYDDKYFKFYPIKSIDIDEYENNSKSSINITA